MAILDLELSWCSIQRPMLVHRLLPVHRAILLMCPDHSEQPPLGSAAISIGGAGSGNSVETPESGIQREVRSTPASVRQRLPYLVGSNPKSRAKPTDSGIGSPAYCVTSVDSGIRDWRSLK